MTDLTSTPTTDEQRIVVGVDGSRGSRVALEWAMTQARLTGATVEAVAGWQQPVRSGNGYVYESDWVGDLDNAAQKMLDETVAEVSARFERPVQVTTSVVEGHAAQVLPAAAKGAELLVVGSRGHGTFAGLLLGSVSQHCVQHSTCAVVVVPTPDPTVPR